MDLVEKEGTSKQIRDSGSAERCDAKQGRGREGHAVLKVVSLPTLPSGSHHCSCPPSPPPNFAPCERNHPDENACGRSILLIVLEGLFSAELYLHVVDARERRGKRPNRQKEQARQRQEEESGNGLLLRTYRLAAVGRASVLNSIHRTRVLWA